MASSYAAPVSATQVGSFFASQYYHVLQEQPEMTHQFYTDASSIVRVDGDSSESASALMQIHTLIMSRIFTNFHIRTINSLDSWSGGVLVVVSGSVKSKDFNGWRKFVQNFFLAPQEKGYFVLNDVFNIVGDEVPDQSPELVVSDHAYDSQPTVSEPVQDQPAASDYALEAEARECDNSVHVGDNPEEDYNLQESQQYDLQEHQQYDLQEHQQYHIEEDQQDPEPEGEALEEGTQLKESSVVPQHVPDTVQEPLVTTEKPLEEPQKFTYASILQAAKGKSAPSVYTQPRSTKSISPVSELDPTSHPPIVQSTSAEPIVQSSISDVAEEGLLHESGETKSIYIRNLPSTATTLDILQELKNFGKIKKDGVFLRNRKDIGICFAFVEFEDAQSVENAVKASPIQLAGRQVYIEERRTTSSGTSRGGRRGGRGRGGRFAGRGFGRSGEGGKQ